MCFSPFFSDTGELFARILRAPSSTLPPPTLPVFFSESVFRAILCSFSTSHLTPAFARALSSPGNEKNEILNSNIPCVCLLTMSSSSHGKEKRMMKIMLYDVKNHFSLFSLPLFHFCFIRVDCQHISEAKYNQARIPSHHATQFSRFSNDFSYISRAYIIFAAYMWAIFRGIRNNFHCSYVLDSLSLRVNNNIMKHIKSWQRKNFSKFARSSICAKCINNATLHFIAANDVMSVEMENFSSPENWNWNTSLAFVVNELEQWEADCEERWCRMFFMMLRNKLRSVAL